MIDNRSTSWVPRQIVRPASTVAEKLENELPTYGRAGLLFAAYFGYLSCLIYLLEREPKLVSSRDPRGRTALHLASWRGHYQCVEYLMEKGVELEAADDEGATALMYAVKEANSVHIVEYLLNSGADASRKDCNNNTALHHCCLSKNEDCGKVLANHLAKSDPKREICNATNNNGETALHIALRNGLIEFMLSFVGYGSGSMWIKDSSGRLPLMSAVDDPDILDCMQLLLSCMMEETPADVSSILSQDRRQSQQSLGRKPSAESETDPEFY